MAQRELRHIIVTVTSPDSYYEQEVIVRRGETPWQAMYRYQSEICKNPWKWYTDENGNKQKYQVGYVCESWRFKPTEKDPTPEKYTQISLFDLKEDNNDDFNK